MKPRRSLLVIATLAVAACGHRPARFANRLPVTEVHDDKPIALPKKRVFIEDLYQADVYVRRELTNGLDPRRTPEALDVSSVDEVPKSSWYRGDPSTGKMLEGYAVDGPPEPPFTLSSETPSSETPNATSFVDARGLSYEWLVDPPGREGMRTAAAAVASRLLHALGYRTPEVHIITAPDGQRAAATRWPPGVDLGPTPITNTRSDDPNDYLPHLERRTLRVLFYVTAWVDMHRLHPRMLRDVYVGKPGRGHVQHHVVGVDGALGAQNFRDLQDWAKNPDREDSNFFLRMFSFGLSPKPWGQPPRTEWPSVGVMADTMLVDEWDMSPPFEPTDSLLPGDAYWISKRIAAVDVKTIDEALVAAQLDNKPREWLREHITKRRTALLAYGYQQTTPCDLYALTEATEKKPAHIDIVDRAVFQGFTPTSQRSYRIRFLNDAGELIMPDRGMAASGAFTSIALEKSLLDQPYFVVEILASHGQRASPLPLQIHVRTVHGQFRVAGVRH